MSGDGIPACRPSCAGRGVALRSTAALPYSVRTNFQEGAAVEIEEIDLAASGSSCPRRKWGVGCRPCAGSVNRAPQPQPLIRHLEKLVVLCSWPRSTEYPAAR